MNICARFVCDWSQPRFPKSSNRPVITKKTMSNVITLPFGWNWKLKNSYSSVVNYAWLVKTGFSFYFFVLSQSLFFSHNGTSPRISHTWPMARVGWPTCECTLSSSSCLNRFHVGKVHTGRKTEIVRERKKKSRIPFWQATRNLLPTNMSFTIFNFSQKVS